MLALRIGVDTGGTFTDFAWLEPAAGGALRRRVLKIASTPDDPAQAVIEGVERILAPLSPRPRQVDVVHGSTVATNTLLARTGARVVLLTTAGFEDILAIGRQDRPRLYELCPSLAPPLVPAELRLGVRERVGARGEVVTELSQAEVRRIVRAVRRQGPEAVAIALLHSFSAPRHEQQLGEALRAELGAAVPVYLSCELDPQPREYERSSTTVLHAYLSRSVRGYLFRLEAGLPRGCQLRVLTSSGGIATVAQACERPADLVLSGPAGGVIGAAEVARQAGITRFIGLDMGGTSTDVCLGWEAPDVQTAGASSVLETSEGTIDGQPLRVPRLAVHTIGAGGGSLARAGSGGALVVGPESAGADPGPAAYGKGQGVTVTDANLLLERLPADRPLGGHTKLYPALARRAIATLAASLGLSPQRCAEGIVLLAEQAMAQAAAQVSQRQGYDPRQCVLLPFGGAGALHACGIAERLGIRSILVPADAGCLSAIGALISRPRRDAAQAVLRELGDWGHAERRAAFAALRRQLSAELKPPLKFTYRLHCRYQGQSFELPISIAGPAASEKSIRELFHQAHEQAYGHCRIEQPVEVVWVQLTAESSAVDVATPAVQARPRRAVTRDLGGPAVIALGTTTVYVAPNWLANEDTRQNLWLRQIQPAGNAH